LRTVGIASRFITPPPVQMVETEGLVTVTVVDAVADAVEVTVTACGVTVIVSVTLTGVKTVETVVDVAVTRT